MTMGWIWTGMIVFSIIYGLISGSFSSLGSAALEGADAAVKLCISICGTTCLWSAVMHLMSECGISSILARTLRPLLARLFPNGSKRPEVLEPITANVSANLLGLGNAATPMGIRAVEAMSDGCEKASDELCRFVVINTASIQLIPATTAAVRASLGAASPFDILPAVWLTSAAALTVGLIAAKCFSQIGRRR